MRPSLLLSAALVLALFALVASCGGSDNPSGTPTATNTAHVITGTPQGQKTGTPIAHEPSTSVAATAPGVTATPPPVASVGTPAAAPADQAAFSTSFTGQQVDLRDCLYNISTAIVDCNSMLFAIDPPMTGQDITCTLWEVAMAAKAIACTSAEPVSTTYYAITQ